MSAIRAYVAALVFAVPIGLLLVLSARGADRVGLDRSDEGPTVVLETGCGLSAESCELP